MAENDPAAISSAEFFDRARARLRFEIPAGLTDPSLIPASGDQGTDRMLAILAREQPIRPAAVLIAVIDRPQPTVLLTQRSAHLNEHAGQISFPGGKIDRDGRIAARCGVARGGRGSRPDARIRRSDRLSRSLWNELRLSHPADGCARSGPASRCASVPAEVDDAFEVPLAFLINPANHQLQSKEFRGVERFYYAMPYGERYIWGATAGILRVLYERIFTP